MRPESLKFYIVPWEIVLGSSLAAIKQSKRYVFSFNLVKIHIDQNAHLVFTVTMSKKKYFLTVYYSSPLLV
jgi:hypothetical protein